MALSRLSCKRRPVSDSEAKKVSDKSTSHKASVCERVIRPEQKASTTVSLDSEQLNMTEKKQRPITTDNRRRKQRGRHLFDAHTQIADFLQEEKAHKEKNKIQRDHETNIISTHTDEDINAGKKCASDVNLNKQIWLHVNREGRTQLQQRISFSQYHINSSNSDVDLSEESDKEIKTAFFFKRQEMYDGDGFPDSRTQDTQEEKEKATEELQTQVDAIVNILKSCANVEQLVLRNAGLTDEMLARLASAVMSSLSEVNLINLNLNHIGPTGCQILLDLLRSKPQVKRLMLFGNDLGDASICRLLNGLGALQACPEVQSTVMQRDHIHRTVLPFTSALQGFFLLELDLGGNGFGTEGIRTLTTYMKQHSKLQYLGLAKTCNTDMAAWEDLFNSFSTNSMLAHIMLDECDLGDRGADLLGPVLIFNKSLRKLDLDYNGIGEKGAIVIRDALLRRTECPLEHLSLEGNWISSPLTDKIQQMVKSQSNN